MSPARGAGPRERRRRGCVGARCYARSSPGSHTTLGLLGAENGSIDDHFGLGAREALVVDSERVGRLVDQVVQLGVGWRIGIDDDLLRVTVAPAADAGGGGFEADLIAQVASG
jgi:hypothetical protein